MPWLTPRPSRKRPGCSAASAACRSATSAASYSQMLRMPVATTMRVVAPSSGRAWCTPGLPPSQIAPYPRLSSSAAASRTSPAFRGSSDRSPMFQMPTRPRSIIGSIRRRPFPAQPLRQSRYFRGDSVASGLLFALLGAAAGGQGGDEGLLRNVDPPDGLHPLLALLLLLQQLALTGDVAAVALGQDVLADGADVLAGDDARADGGLDGHLVLLPGNELLQLGGHHQAVLARLVLVHDLAERVHRLALQQDVDLDQVGLLLAAGLVVQRGVPAGLGLELVEEVEDDLGERQGVPDLDPVLGQV